MLKRVLAVIGVLAVLLVLFLAGVEVMYYTESTAFCTTCHKAMNPEKVTHQLSAHAEVDCGTCHVGPGVLWMVKTKLENVRYLWLYPTGSYEKPIPTPIDSLRPAETICGQCHQSDISVPSRLKTVTRYAEDEGNTPTQIELLMKIGGGELDPEGIAEGAHWHVENPVYYVAADEQRLEIPWVQVERDGQAVEYVELGSDAVDETDKRLMDCYDCHNRDQHTVTPLAEALDLSLEKGTLPSLPAIKQVGMDVLGTKYTTAAEADAAIDKVSEFYQTEYPQVYADRQAEVQQAVQELRILYEQQQFPFMQVYWDTYPDHVGHKYFPGCMRCHDGEHLNDQGEAIRAECNLCHSLPQAAEESQMLPALVVAPGEMPDSHDSSLWIAEHRYSFDVSCSECHTVSNPGGSDNISFCSNGACHGLTWPYLAIDSEAIVQLVAPEWGVEGEGVEPPVVPHPFEEGMDCKRCHGPEEVLAFPENHVDYELGTCTMCHHIEIAESTAEPVVSATETATPEETITPEATAVETQAATETAVPEATATLEATAMAEVPGIPHEIEGRENCLQCHDVVDGVVPAPESHKGYKNDICQSCHAMLAITPEATSTAEPTKAVTATATARATATEKATVEATKSVTGTPTVTVEATAEVTAEATQSAEVTVPVIPHEIEDRENCLSCHDVVDGLVPAPESHKDYENDVCQTCHQVAGATPEAIDVEDLDKEGCLNCHGPFEELRAATEEYQVSENEVANPHQWVPHDQQTTEKIVECTNCHEPHPLPATPDMEVAEPKLQWCYSSCHHTGTLMPCSACH